jgi:hypothetical protein
MSDIQALYYFNNRDYQIGFDARSLGEPLDKAQSEAWQMGWHVGRISWTKANRHNHIFEYSGLQ